jgi:PDZ domain-containing protein
MRRRPWERGLLPRPRLSRFLSAGWLLAAGVVLLAVVAALWLLPSNEYLLLPDRARPVSPLVTVAGRPRPRQRDVYFVDVVIRKASLLEQLFGGLHAGADLVPASAVVAPGLTGNEQQVVDEAEMRRSQVVAAALAERALGKKVTATPTGVRVLQTEPGSPAEKRFRPEDVILAVDGRQVRTPAELTSLMRRKRVGQRVRFTVRRGRRRLLLSMRTVAASPGSRRAIVGILPGQAAEIHVPIPVSIDTNGVVGPSAGLAFALDILEQLGRDVVRGHKVAATGEVFLNGAVGPIGGVKQKTYGAREAGVDAFLVPAGQNAQEARKYAHGLKIIPVKSFQQALRALATFAS